MLSGVFEAGLELIWASLGSQIGTFGGVQGGIFGTSSEPRGCRRARLQFRSPHFDPPWARDGPKRVLEAPKWLQTDP